MILKTNRVRIGYWKKLRVRVGYRVPVGPWSGPTAQSFFAKLKKLPLLSFAVFPLWLFCGHFWKRFGRLLGYKCGPSPTHGKLRAGRLTDPAVSNVNQNPASPNLPQSGWQNQKLFMRIFNETKADSSQRDQICETLILFTRPISNRTKFWDYIEQDRINDKKMS